jgi:hypothetical protein
MIKEILDKMAVNVSFYNSRYFDMHYKITSTSSSKTQCEDAVAAALYFNGRRRRRRRRRTISILLIFSA